MKRLFCFSGILLIVFACSSQKAQIQSAEFNSAINKCYELKQKQLQEETVSNKCIDCFEELIKDFPDSIKAYQLLMNEYMESGNFKSADQTLQKGITKFGKVTDLLIQKNFISYSEKADISDEDLKLLVERYHSNEISNSQKLDLGVLLTLKGDHSTFDKMEFSKEEKEMIKQISSTR